jgi:hypothetical protein
VLRGELAECGCDTVFVVSALLVASDYLSDFVLLVGRESVEAADSVTRPFAGLGFPPYRVITDSVLGCHVLRRCIGL